MSNKLESNEQQMIRIAKEIVTEMNLSKQINDLKFGEKVSLKIWVSSFLKRLKNYKKKEK
jgi:hypothetical protein